MTILVDLRYQIMLKIKMDRTPQKITEDPKRQEAASKGREKYMII